MLVGLLVTASGAVLDEEPVVEDVNPEYVEWILQLAIARSILEAKARGDPLDETEEGLVPWAEALLEMRSAQPASDEAYKGLSCLLVARASAIGTGLLVLTLLRSSQERRKRTRRQWTTA